MGKKNKNTIFSYKKITVRVPAKLRGVLKHIYTRDNNWNQGYILLSLPSPTEEPLNNKVNKMIQLVDISQPSSLPTQNWNDGHTNS